jgi:hypothetical protein
MHGPVLSEHDLRYLWEHRLYSPEGLRTADGEPVTVISPGSPNYDSGPDFADALIRIGGLLFRGDVEVHVHAGDWVAHRHHLDTRYNGVILHVALRTGAVPALTASNRELPLLLLPTPLRAQHAGALPPPHAEPPPLHCPGTPRADGRALVRRLSHLGLQRLEEKRLRLERRLVELAAASGLTGIPRSRELWEQVLYEGVAEGLGYSKNREPFRSLARNVTLADLRRVGLDDREGIMAALFGAASLLPSPRRITEAESRHTVRRLRARWKELPLDVRTLDETEWKAFHLRPANLPTARLASLAFLLPQLFGPGATQQLVSLFHREDESCASRLREMRQRFTIHPDEFWSRHLYFGTPQHSHGIAIGLSRSDDIIVNTLLPWILLYAGKFQQPRIEQNVLLTYRTFPPLQRNRVTFQVERLLTRYPLASAQLHQGALEWERRYCRRGCCTLCPILPPAPRQGG